MQADGKRIHARAVDASAVHRIDARCVPVRTLQVGYSDSTPARSRTQRGVTGSPA